MTRRFFGLQSALLGVLLFGSCKQDSITTVGIGTAARVSLEFNARTVAVADSVRTFARVLDKVGNPLAITVTLDRKSTRLNSSHVRISYAVFCLKKKKKNKIKCL